METRNNTDTKDYIRNIDSSAERRFVSSELRTEKRVDGDEPSKYGTIEGVAAKVGDVTVIRDHWGEFEEVIERGAFDDVLNDDIRALINHDPNLILARSVGGKGTLSVFPDDNGNLAYRYDTPDISYAQDLDVSVSRGDITQSSFAFKISEGGQEWDMRSERGEGLDRRTITKIERLYDVSPVTYPAYANTEVAKRSFDGAIEARKAEQEKQEEPGRGNYDAADISIIINQNLSK